MQTDLTHVQAGARKTEHIDYGRALQGLTFGTSSRVVNVAGWIVLGLCLVLFLGQALKAVDPQDEGQFLTYPWLMAKGWMPYRDIWMSYPPATYLVLVPFYKIGVMGLVAERSLGIIARVFYILLVNRAVTGSWRRYSWLAALTTFCLLFIASDTKPYPWLIALPIFVGALRELRQRPPLAAALFFLAGTFRFEFALAGLFGMIILTALDRWGRWTQSKLELERFMDRSSPKRYLQPIFLLAASFLLFYGLLDVITGGWAWRDIFVDQIITVQQGRYVSIFPLPFGVIGVPVLFAMLAAPLLMIVAGLLYWRADIVATNAAVAFLMPHFLQRVDGSHLFSMSALVIPWAVIGLADLWRSTELWPGGWVGSWAKAAIPKAWNFSRFVLGWLGITVSAWCALIVVAYAVYLSPLSPLASQPPSQFASRVVSGKETIIAWTAYEARDDQQVADFLGRNSRAGQRIFVVPASLTSNYTRTDFYYLSGLLPATRYMEVQPGILTQTSVQRYIIGKLRSCEWIVLLHGGEWYGPSPHSVGSILEAYIRSHYRTRVQNATYAVLEKTG